MLNNVLVPFQITFMQEAFMVGAMIALISALLSPFIVLKSMALVGDAIAHAILPGLIIAAIIGIPVVIGAFVAGLLCIWVAGFLQANTRIKVDTALGVAFSIFFAVGLVLHTKFNTGLDIHRILLGDILGINRHEFIQITVITALISAIIWLKWRDFMLFSFDPIQAKAVGLNVVWLHYGLLFMLVTIIVGAITTTGVILSIAFLIAPGVIGVMLTQDFKHLMIISVMVALGATCGGIYISFFINSAPAPTIILIFALIFCFVFILRRKKYYKIS